MTEPSPIITAVDALPADSITVKILNTLDFVVPGEWRNVVGFDKTAQDVLGTGGSGLERRALHLPHHRCGSPVLESRV